MTIRHPSEDPQHQTSMVRTPVSSHLHQERGIRGWGSERRCFHLVWLEGSSHGLRTREEVIIPSQGILPTKGLISFCGARGGDSRHPLNTLGQGSRERSGSTGKISPLLFPQPT